MPAHRAACSVSRHGPLLDALDIKALDPAVIDNLDEARCSLGDNGSFGVKVPKRPRKRVDAKKIEQLRTVARDPNQPTSPAAPTSDR